MFANNLFHILCDFLKFLVKISDSLVLRNELKLSCITRP